MTADKREKFVHERVKGNIHSVEALRRKGLLKRILLLGENESLMIYYKIGRQRRGKMIVCKADYAETEGLN